MSYYVFDFGHHASCIMLPFSLSRGVGTSTIWAMIRPISVLPSTIRTPYNVGANNAMQAVSLSPSSSIF